MDSMISVPDHSQLASVGVRSDDPEKALLARTVLALHKELALLRSAVVESSLKSLCLVVESDRSLLLRNLGLPNNEILMIPLEGDAVIEHAEALCADNDRISSEFSGKAIRLKRAFIASLPSSLQ